MEKILNQPYKTCIDIHFNKKFDRVVDVVLIKTNICRALQSEAYKIN
jgi:hypothetical protein